MLDVSARQSESHHSGPRQPGDEGASSKSRKECTRPQSQRAIEPDTKNGMQHFRTICQATARPEPDARRLKSYNVETSDHLDSTALSLPASAHEWPREDLSTADEDLSGSFDLMPEFEFLDNFELPVTNFRDPGSGFGLSSSVSTPRQSPNEEAIRSRFPVESFTDAGQQSRPALTPGSRYPCQPYLSPISPSRSPHPLPPAATQGTALGGQRPSKVPSTPDTRCQNQCYTSLMEQMSRLGDVRSSSASIPFDIILSQEEDVRRQRKTILACPSCMGAPRSRQTNLLPIIMVFESLIRLFEWGGDGDRCCYYHHEHLRKACSEHLRGGSGEPPHTSSNSDDVTGQQGRQRDQDQYAPRLHMPQTSQPMFIGHFKVDEPAKAIFLRQLLRLHLERHLVTVLELSKRLSTGPQDVSYKVARGILTEIRRRIEHFQGCLASAG